MLFCKWFSSTIFNDFLKAKVNMEIVCDMEGLFLFNLSVVFIVLIHGVSVCICFNESCYSSYVLMFFKSVGNRCGMKLDNKVTGISSIWNQLFPMCCKGWWKILSYNKHILNFDCMWELRFGRSRNKNFVRDFFLNSFFLLSSAVWLLFWWLI